MHTTAYTKKGDRFAVQKTAHIRKTRCIAVQRTAHTRKTHRITAQTIANATNPVQHRVPLAFARGVSVRLQSSVISSSGSKAYGRRELDAVGRLDRAGENRRADVEAVHHIARERFWPRHVVPRLQAEQRPRDADDSDR